ncbi:hypothetical protein [uncultured Sphingobium sp.]|uniref:hypothetical protein n=1 Tax=uncultured Sphingobium sp. TaxID=316087 RepID=UPI00259BAB3C|nr:hypothetical protein [uncultured Sphingobium sp.]
MFKVISETLVWWPVLFAGVTEEGEVVENKIEMRFRILDEDAIDDFVRSTNLILSPPKSPDAPDGGVEREVERRIPSEQMQRGLSPIVCDWRMVAAANGELLPFNEGNFRALLRVPNVFQAILAAYAACRAGRAEIRAGN